jgi:alkanesulfonate monooxygenase SsuD/methylene tetrahydromethanopterin reductase-like flavin-dependent oxidoreductase (luciferase family)
MALSGAALAVTKNIRVATGVTNPNTRHPQIMASAAATLCDISGGRFVLGIRRFPLLRLGSNVRAQVPLMLAAFGPNSSSLAGRCFDEVLLHTYFTDETTSRIVGRLATYLQAPGYGELLVKTNRWDLSVLQKFRADPVVSTMRGAIDEVATPDQIEQIAGLIPESWLEGSAKGSPEACADSVRGQFDLGVDAVILHGANPDMLRPVVGAYRADLP